jgi:hypothetical protein
MPTLGTAHAPRPHSPHSPHIVMQGHAHTQSQTPRPTQPTHAHTQVTRCGVVPAGAAGSGRGRAWSAWRHAQQGCQRRAGVRSHCLQAARHPLTLLPWGAETHCLPRAGTSWQPAYTPTPTHPQSLRQSVHSINVSHGGGGLLRPRLHSAGGHRSRCACNAASTKLDVRRLLGWYWRGGVPEAVAAFPAGILAGVCMCMCMCVRVCACVWYGCPRRVSHLSHSGHQLKQLLPVR